MRASWKGYFRIGNVSAPVRLYAATRSVAPQFVQLHAKDHSPVQRVTMCMQDGEVLGEGDIVKAAKHGGGYVELGDDELEQSIGLQRDIVVRQITPKSDIDPLHYDKPYYIVPEPGGEFTYAILRRAFENSGKAAIATFLFYGSERLAAISSKSGMLHIHTLHFDEEILPPSNIKMPAMPQPSPKQVSLAMQLLEHYNAPFFARDYRDYQSDLVNELIERRAKGLPSKKRQAIGKDTTPDDELMVVMKKMLGEGPESLGA